MYLCTPRKREVAKGEHDEWESFYNIFTFNYEIPLATFLLSLWWTFSQSYQLLRVVNLWKSRHIPQAASTFNFAASTFNFADVANLVIWLNPPNFVYRPLRKRGWIVLLWLCNRHKVSCLAIVHSIRIHRAGKE